MGSGRPRTGTVFYRPAKKLWVARTPVIDGRRREFAARTEAEARAKLLAVHEGMPLPPVAPHRPRDLMSKRAKLAARIVQRGLDLGWSVERLGAVLAHSLTLTRVAYEISGPCAYCGDELATTVDHVIPTKRGGPDIPDNRVSACATCNNRKGNRTPDEWTQQRMPAAGLL